MKQLFSHTALILILNFFFQLTQAQDFNHYQPILCKGNLPKEITTASSEKYRREMLFETLENKRSDQKAKEKFLLYQRFFTDNLLKSGKIIVNPELTDYLNEILDILLKDEPAVRAKIHIYILRSPSVNALAMNDGTILICWGLLAQLDNEAQLAYVLSHEITHFKERHVLDQFQERRKKKRKDFGRSSQERTDAHQEALVSKYTYAKQLEADADSFGLIRYLKTGYSTEAPEQTFDKLKYAYLPFANMPLNMDMFNLDGISIPEKYLLKETNHIKGTEENENDSLSSHPNWGKRRNAIRNALKGKEMGGSPFLVSAEKFMQLQNIARFELPQAYLHYQLYEEAFYNAYLLLLDNPNNFYLQNIIAKSLNGMVKRSHEKTITLEDRKVEVEKLEGELQKVYHLFKEMRNDELNLLALNYVWKLHKKYPKEFEPKAMVGELFQELVDEHYEKKDELVLSESAAKEKEVNWSKLLLKSHLKDTSFTNYFTACLETKQENAEWRKKHRFETFDSFLEEQERKGARLGIDKIVLVNPRYFYESMRKTKDLGFFTTEEGNNHLQTLVADVADKAKLPMQLLSLANVAENETEKFNEVTLLTEWASEQLNTKGTGIGSQQKRINEIADKYDTRYFLWLDVVEVKIKKEYNTVFMQTVTMALSPYIWPISLRKIFGGRYATAIYATLYDVKTGRVHPVKQKLFLQKASDMVLYSQLYDAFAQIKYKKRK